MVLVTMYEMKTCPHCVRARAEIAKYRGPVSFVIKNHTEAPSGSRGFPFFVAENGKSVAGYGDMNSLLQSLGIKENFCGVVRPANMHIGVM